jgi:glycosyltransferase involved in cell wall biosynthesis
LCLKKGAKFSDVILFSWSRSFLSQLKMGSKALMFFPSVPFHFNQFPWVIEIEDTTSLFLPFLRNGETSKLGPLKNSGYFPIYKELVESPNCRALITHIKSTADSLPIIFENPALETKIFHIPMGIQPPDWERVRQVKARRNGGPLILFTNSWHQMTGGFYVRGGLDVIEAFRLIKEKVPDARLVIRSRLPRNLPARHRALVQDLGIEVIDTFLPKEKWEQLKMEAGYFLFPAARIHIVSTLEAMAYGMTLITSNGWGVDEYVKDGENGIVVPGRHRVSWMDWKTGILREDYAPMYEANLPMAESLAEAFLKVHDDPALKEKITVQARRDVDEKYTLKNWNARLKEIFDQVGPA